MGNPENPMINFFVLNTQIMLQWGREFTVVQGHK